jgi:Fe-S-cluster-containing dehydrogenase component/CRP-like cAMP-binding protein
MKDEAFPAHVPLEGILANDVRQVAVQPGDVILREGDYGSTVFLILSGDVVVFPNPLPERSTSGGMARIRRRGHRARLAVNNLDRSKAEQAWVPLTQGDWFGEMAALSRTERSATIVAETAVTLAEFRWPGIRDLRRYDVAYKRHIDKLYRERSLSEQLEVTDIFEHCDDADRTLLREQIQFETYGTYDWTSQFSVYQNMSYEERLGSEPIVAAEGDYLNGLFVIRGGVGRITKRVGTREQTVAYLGRGGVFGLRQAFHAWQGTGTHAYELTLRAVGHVDILFIPFPTAAHVLFGPTSPKIKTGAVQTRIPASTLARHVGAQSTELHPILDQLMEKRMVAGTATMLIDLHRCTRCDACVEACSDTHGGTPRFVRAGAVFASASFTSEANVAVMAANACMHCADPVCMIGCPTSAMRRDQLGGQVHIVDERCIGCGTCAQSCPYDAIRLVPSDREQSASSSSTPTEEITMLKATKCDLCMGLSGGPACVRACPTDALHRYDFTSDDVRLESWIPT